MSSESFPSGSDVLKGAVKSLLCRVGLDPLLLTPWTHLPTLLTDLPPVVIHLYNKVKERAKDEQGNNRAEPSEVGACETDGGKFCAFCDEHNYFVQGTRKSLEGRFTFEICPKCEWPNK